MQKGGLAQSKVQGLVADLASRATAASLTTGLSGKQDVIPEGGLAQSKVQGLPAALGSKQDLLSDLPGTGVTLLLNNQVRRLFGHGGIALTQHLELADENDPRNFQVRVSGEALQTAIATLQQNARAFSSTGFLPETTYATWVTGNLNISGCDAPLRGGAVHA